MPRQGYIGLASIACKRSSKPKLEICLVKHNPKPPPNQTPPDVATPTPPSTIPLTLILPETYRSRVACIYKTEGKCGLASSLPEVDWKLRSIGNHSTLYTMHTDMPGFDECQRLPSDKQQTSRNPTYPHISNQEELLVPNQSSPTLMLKVPDWRTWAYTGGSCQIQNGKQEIGAGVYCPLTDSTKSIELNDSGITNTMCRAELAAISAVITHSVCIRGSYSHIASDSLISLHQIC
eukprot:1146992-Pelagomonas_calceolata.AAC.1